MMMKLLECKGGYDEYEAAEFVFLSMIHDIGAYRTNKITDDLDYDTETSGTAHAVYGALFLKQVSPFVIQSGYYYVPSSAVFQKSAEPITSTAGIAMYLYLLEEVDSLFRQYGEALDTKSV